MAKIKVDFGGVDPEIRKGGNKAAHVPEGDYLVKVLSGEVRKSERSGSRYITWKFQIVEPNKFKGKTVYGSTSLKAEALWSLRNLIHAATGKNVAGKAVTFDPENIVGKIVGAAIEDNEFSKNGQTRVTSQVSTCFPRDEYEAPEDDDEEEDEEIEDDEDEDEDLEEVDVDEI